MTQPRLASSGPGAAMVGEQMRIALIGDIHDYALGIWPWELLGKTLAGQLNLWINRRKKFDRSLIAPTIARIAACEPNLALFSGDLTTTSRPREFRSVDHALAPLLNRFYTVMVAGNHDRYTFTARRTRRFERFFPGYAPEQFPFARPLIGGWRLIAVDSAVPRLFDSRGRIGNRQLQHVQSLLKSIDDDEGVVILCHYPFGKPPTLPPMKQGHRLIDEQAWRDTITACRGRVILIHGHVHCPWIWQPLFASGGRPSQNGEPTTHLLDLNAGSPTLVGGAAWPRGQGFWMMDLSADPSQPIALEHHVMGGGEGPVGVDPMLPAERDEESPPAWTVRRMELSI